MLYLLLAIVAASTYSILFKIFACRDVDSLQAIAFNYLTATLLGILLSVGSLGSGVVLGGGDWAMAVVMGVMFMAAFVLMARSTARSGVSVTTVAARVSLTIPVVCSYLFLPDQTEPRWGAIAVILAALVMVIWQPRKGEASGDNHKPHLGGGLLLPFAVFLLFGLNNFCLKWTQSGLEGEGGASQLSAAIFLFAALASGGYYFAVSPAKRFSWQAMVGGVALGVANFFTTYFMILALAVLPSGLFFPIYHIGIVAVVATLGVMLFGERLSCLQIAGLGLAAVGIVAFFV